MFNFAKFRKLTVKKIDYTRLLALSFILVIFVGGVLLNLSISNLDSSIPFVDHLFMSTSATCVTGLVTVVVAEKYTVFGQIVLIFLMQIGGLGLMTFLAIFILMSKKHLYFAEKKLVQNALNKADMEDIPKYIKSIFRYTFIFEFIGFLIFSFRLVPEFGFIQGLFNSLFLAVSAFCNAGLDNFSPLSIIPYSTDPVISLGIIMLIIMGSLGFAVWFDLSKGFKTKLSKKVSFKQIRQHFTLHTKVALSMTIILLFIGTFSFMINEYNNSLTIKEFSFIDKLIISFFQSTTLRTAGFSSVNIGDCKPITLIIMCMLMFIGGSPGGTSGGIKTTTFTVLILSIIAAFKNSGDHYRIFKREIPKDTFNKAFVIFFVYLSLLVVALSIMAISDESIALFDLFYESVSALATVGLSTGITTTLTNIGKLVIISLMFIGRVGPITIVFALMKNKTKKKEIISYANEDVLIG